MAINRGKTSRRRRERPARLNDDSDPANEFDEVSEHRESATNTGDGAQNSFMQEGRSRTSPFLVQREATNTAKDSSPVDAESPAKRARRGRTKRELDELRASSRFKSAIGLIQHLISDSRAYLFARPVHELWTEEELPGYNEVVKKPMDLGTVLKNTRALEYVVEREDGSLEFDDVAFFADVQRVFRNCMLYNDRKSEYFRDARRLLAQADRRFKARPAISPPTEQTGRGPGVPLAPVHSAKVERQLQHETRDQSSYTTQKQNGTLKRASVMPGTSSTTAPLPNVKTGRRPFKAEIVPQVPPDPREPTPKVDDGNPGLVKPPATILKLPNYGASKLPNYDASKLPNYGAAKLPDLIVPKQAVNGLSGTIKTPALNSGPSSFPIKKPSKVAHTSSISSDEQEVAAAEPAFKFVSTVGMEKKRGRKSALVQDLELRHEQLMKRRKLLQDSASSLEKLKKVDMTLEEKAVLCDRVAVLDFVGMKVVVDIIARGMNRHDILNEVEVDMDIDAIDNGVLREIQAFLDNSTVIAALGTLRNVEEELAEVEAQIVNIRYHKVS